MDRGCPEGFGAPGMGLSPGEGPCPGTEDAQGGFGTAGTCPHPKDGECPGAEGSEPLEGFHTTGTGTGAARGMGHPGDRSLPEGTPGAALTSAGTP